ncbi:hypothetical protein BJ165DRAFT_576402 [Panaeolus papilionaceus]|nr:hypothetical protein BJ165DRAFT_576402 [Panaeolus papilionaceus]
MILPLVRLPPLTPDIRHAWHPTTYLPPHNVKASFKWSLFFSTLAAATTTITVFPPWSNPARYTDCFTGRAQCCSSVEPADTGPTASLLLNYLDIAVTPSNSGIGISCYPFNPFGPVTPPCNLYCCQENGWGGLIAVGCLPIFVG